MDDTTTVTTVSIDYGALAAILVIPLILAIFMIVAFWRVFAKAGQPGWAAIIPIYNVYIQCKVAGRSGWWVLLYLIPIVNIVIAIIVGLDIARAFGKGGGFGFFGLVLFPFIGYPILAFGRAQYVGGNGSGYRGPEPGYPRYPGA